MLESSMTTIEEFFNTDRGRPWRPLPFHNLEQSQCHPIIDKRQYNNENGSGVFYYCKLHPDIDNINLESIEHHCKYKDPELHKSEILKLRAHLHI